ncbi:uncharacterized protein RSE6_14943 [Rhynchosporium secalis]|uniref:Uncharacterized protein n=1 Tax=Rhynchosporium secalis TaxID=38038 RepID=A0A1E1MWG4_RHYSE|nr:uncharacterized protein RSE6_14943 [Rhynchosporium secalis]
MSRGILESFDDVRRGHDITDYLVGLSVLGTRTKRPVSKSWGILKKECIGGCIYLYNKIQSIGRSIGECRRRRTTCTGVIERKFDNEYEGLAASQDVYWDSYRDSGQAGGVLKKEGPGPLLSKVR